jgi:hypothetical protein
MTSPLNQQNRSSMPPARPATATRIVTALALSLVATQVHAKVIYEDKRHICFDNGQCQKKMTQEEMDGAAKYLTPEQQREYEIFKNATQNPELLKKLLTSPQKPNVTSQAYEAGSFPLSAKDAGATIRELKGIDTVYAIATGTVTRGDAEEYCTRDPGSMTVANGGKLSLEQCIASILEERKGKVYKVEADCPEGAMRINGDKTYKLEAIDLRTSDRPGIWLSEDAEIIEGASAAGDLLLDMRFQLVCPARWKEVHKSK